MTEKKKEEWLNAYGRLSLKDRVVLVVFAIIGLSAVSLAIIYLFMSAPLVVRSSFPDDGLAEVSYSSGASPASYSNLPRTIRIPDSPYVMDVGGEEMYVGETGTSFRYSDSTVIIIFYEPSGTKTADILKNNLSAYLVGDGTVSCLYRKKSEGEGYYGTLPLHYEGGVAKVGEDTFCVLSYRYATVEGKDIVVVCATTNEDALLDDRRLLLQVVDTLGVVGNGKDVSEERKGG